MMSEGPSILILFTFEYVLLASMMVTTFCKYAVYLIDVRRHGRWGGKAGWIPPICGNSTSMHPLTEPIIWNSTA